MPEKTKGEKRVRTDFNVSASSTVDVIKQKSAELIDLIDTIKMPVFKPGDPFGLSEFERLKHKAQLDIEQGAMWAVKAATY